MIRGRSTRKTVQERQAIHPLQLNDPEALKYIKLVRWDFILREIDYPVPRRQDIPPRAFGEINGKCIVLCTSHAWYYQCHPDPEGTKLQIMRSHFGPLLRERYPDTEILLFGNVTALLFFPHTQTRVSSFTYSSSYLFPFTHANRIQNAQMTGYAVRRNRGRRSRTKYFPKGCTT